MKRFFLPLLLVAACGAPQPTTPPVDLSLDPARIPTGTLVSDLTITRDSSTTSLGEAIQGAERLAIDGREVLRLTLEQRLPMASMFDTLEVDASTLRPLRYRNVFGAFQSITLRYDEAGRVQGTVARAGEIVTIDTLIAGVFYDASDFLPLVPALPLAEGFEAFVPVYSYDFGLDTLSVRVTGSGTLAHGGSDRPVWLVDYATPGGAAATLSIDRETGRLLRTESTVQDGGLFVQAAR